MKSTTFGVFLKASEGGTIITAAPALLDGTAQYEQLHDLVGGYLECFHQIPSPSGGDGRVIQFYCDEDGGYKNLTLNLRIFGHRIVGPVVIVAAELPEIMGLTEEEAQLVRNHIRAVASLHSGY